MNFTEMQLCHFGAAH